MIDLVGAILQGDLLGGITEGQRRHENVQRPQRSQRIAACLTINASGSRAVRTFFAVALLRRRNSDLLTRELDPMTL